MNVLPISVIIVARNAEDTMRDCLDSVRRNNPAEIIVVDGNSMDRTVAIAQRYTEKLYDDGGRGIGYARQLGAEKAIQEYVAYVDSDVILTEGALATMLTEFQKSTYISLHARVSPDNKCSGYWEWAQQQHHQFSTRHGEPIGMLASIFRRGTILKYGFDPSAENLDDMSLEFKLKKDGYRFGISSAQVYHHWKAGFRRMVAHRFILGRYKPRAILKYGPWHAGFWPPLSTAYWLSFWLAKGKLKLIPYQIVDGVVQTAGMIKGFWEIMKGTNEGQR